MFGISAFAAAPFASLSDVSVIVALSGVQASGTVGDVVASRINTESGVQANGYVGTFGPITTVALTGVSANGSVGTPLYFYWTTIDDNQTPSWQNIDNTQTAGWAVIDDEQTPSWQEVVMVV
jgi:hypothetical protein